MYLFLVRGEGREKEKEGNSDVWEIHHIVASSTCPTTRHVPWPGIEPVTLWFTGWHSIHRATLASAKFLIDDFLQLDLQRTEREKGEREREREREDSTKIRKERGDYN